MRWALYVLAGLGVWTVASCIAGPLIGRYIASREPHEPPSRRRGHCGKTTT